MKVFSSIFLFLFIASTVSAQFDATWGYINAKQVDSLKLAVKSELNDTLNMAAFRKLGFYYAESDDDTTIYFHQRQLELAVKLKLQIWEADAYSSPIRLASTTWVGSGTRRTHVAAPMNARPMKLEIMRVCIATV